MSTDPISLVLEPRDTIGKQVKAMRRDGIVPAVIHDHGHDSVIVSANALEIQKAYHEAGKHHPVELDVKGKKYMAMIKDVKMEPTKSNMQHVVFQAIKLGEKVEAEIPLTFEGEVPAEKVSLLVLRNIDRVMVEAQPQNLPDRIAVDQSGLVEIGDRITVADLKLPAGVEMITEPEHIIAIVEEPKVHEVEDTSAEVAEGEEPAAADETPAEGKSEE